MSAYLLVVVALLAGQVGAAPDPYGAVGQSAAGAGNKPTSQADEGLVPVLQLPPGGNLPESPFRRQEQQSPLVTDSPPPGYSGFQSQSNPPQETSPATSAAPPDSTRVVKPSALMRAMLTSPAASRLNGEPVTLAEILAGTASRAEQTQRIEAYWDLCSSVADYYLGLGELDELRRLRASVPRIGETWEQAEREFAVRIGTSERAARASQLRLASWLGGRLPLPGDMPHCGSYHTRYDQIFAGRPSPEAQELSELVPQRYVELKDAAHAVSRAESWLHTIESIRNENSDGTGTLRALELWALRRRAFIQIARDYNRRIARYSELATPGQVPAERLVSMLILRDNSATAARTPNPTSRPNGQRDGGRQSVPRTFSGGWSPAAPGSMIDSTRDDAVQPASGESENQPRRERSLLVKPR